jgi:hypothetical protein
MFEKISNTQDEKNEYRCKMFKFLDDLHEKYHDKNEVNLKPINDKKKYKHDYYMRNKEKYKKKKEQSNA